MFKLAVSDTDRSPIPRNCFADCARLAVPGADLSACRKGLKCDLKNIARESLAGTDAGRDVRNQRLGQLTGETILRVPESGSLP
jgi:hypothetical protein